MKQSTAFLTGPQGRRKAATDRVKLHPPEDAGLAVLALGQPEHDLTAHVGVQQEAGRTVGGDRGHHHHHHHHYHHHHHHHHCHHFVTPLTGSGHLMSSAGVFCVHHTTALSHI